MHVCVHPCITEGQRKSVDPESKASASLNRDSEAIEGVPLKVLTTALPTAPLGMQDWSKMALDTHLCSPVVSERASSERGDWLWWLCGAR